MIPVEKFLEAILHLFDDFSEINISSTTYSDCSKSILGRLGLKRRPNDLRNLKKLYKLWREPMVKEEIKKRLSAKHAVVIFNQVEPAEISTSSDIIGVDMDIEEQEDIEESVEISNENQIQVREELLINIRKNDEIANLNVSIQSLREINEKLSNDLEDSKIMTRELKRKNEDLSAEFMEIRNKFNEKCIELESTKLLLRQTNENRKSHENSALNIEGENLPLNSAGGEIVSLENEQGVSMENIDCLDEQMQANILQSANENVCEIQQNFENEIVMSACPDQTLGSKSTIKRKKPVNNRRLNHNTRSQRPATVPKNTTFEWVALNGYPSRPCFIHPAMGKEEALAQPVSIIGDLCQKKFSFSRTEHAINNKPKNFVAALKKFNDLYGTNYF